jgi:L-seryl-tRNA(Ser) seleniumtransferase
MPDQQLLRQIPSVSEFLNSEAGGELCAEFGEGLVKLQLRAELESLRGEVRGGTREAVPATVEIAAAMRPRLLRAAAPEGRRAINATGIVLHAGLGRAPLPAEALAALGGTGGYTLLETDPETGGRSRREEVVERMLVALTGCEAATVVNNNAAATMLMLNTLSEGREAIVSRGQLIEIGGDFRMPEVVARSGAVMRAVGATNRTHLRDYEAAIGRQTGVIVHVHSANYRVRGFSGAPGIEELCALGRSRSLPVVDDLGTGALVPLSEFGLSDEPLVRDSVSAGAALTCFSGDKLICGPQAGIICGTREAIRRVRENSLARMLRPCRLTFAALEAALLHFVNGTHREGLPLYRMLSRPVGELEAAAAETAGQLAGVGGLEVSVIESRAGVGIGSPPEGGGASRAVELAPLGISVEELARRLRAGVPAVFGRVSDDRLLLDLRTVFPRETEALVRRVREALSD